MPDPTLSPSEYAVLRQLVSGRSVDTIPERLVDLGFVRSEKLKRMPDLVKMIWAPTKSGKLYIARLEGPQVEEDQED